MQDICEVNAISLFGVNVTKDDVNVIADTLSDIVKNWDSADVKKYLCVHWKNMVGCINVASESDRNFMRSRSDIFEEAENRNLVKSFPDKGELITTWSRRLVSEIEKGGLKHFSHFNDIAFQSGSIRGFFNGKKYHLNLKKIRHFLKRATKTIDIFNEKAFGAIKEFVDYSYDLSKSKPWSSPLFIFVIVLLVLFTVCGTAVLSIAFGSISMIYRISILFCQLCTVYYDSAGVFSLAKIVLNKIGII